MTVHFRNGYKVQIFTDKIMNLICITFWLLNTRDQSAEAATACSFSSPEFTHCNSLGISFSVKYNGMKLTLGLCQGYKLSAYKIL